MRFFNKTSIKSIISILKKNLNLILMFAILILVILIITKHRREGVDPPATGQESANDADNDRDLDTRDETWRQAGRSGPSFDERRSENTDDKHINMHSRYDSRNMTAEEKAAFKKTDPNTWRGESEILSANNKQSMKTYTRSGRRGAVDRADDMLTRRGDSRAGDGAADAAANNPQNTTPYSTWSRARRDPRAGDGAAALAAAAADAAAAPPPPRASAAVEADAAAAAAAAAGRRRKRSRSRRRKRRSRRRTPEPRGRP